MLCFLFGVMCVKLTVLYTSVLNTTPVMNYDIFRKTRGTNTEIINSRHFLVKLMKTKHKEKNSQAVREKRSCHDNPKEVTSDF